MKHLDVLQEKIFNEISKTQIYLYCTPKCGGTSLYDTLNTLYNTFHVHSQLFFEKYYTNKEIVKNSFNLIDCIEESSKNYDEIYIIDVYRKPIERNMSYFFHIIDELIPDYKDKTVEELITFFNKNIYFQYEQSIDEITNHYGINLYEIPFDNSKMYLTYKFNNINFVVLHFDYIDKWNDILSELLSRNINILNRNIGDKKDYANMYKQYKNNYKVPAFILDFIKYERNFNYFNTENEIEQYIQYWNNRIDNDLKYSQLPKNFDANIYKKINNELDRMNDLELRWHYMLFGENENRKFSIIE